MSYILLKMNLGVIFKRKSPGGGKVSLIIKLIIVLSPLLLLEECNGLSLKSVKNLPRSLGSTRSKLVEEEPPSKSRTSSRKSLRRARNTSAAFLSHVNLKRTKGQPKDYHNYKRDNSSKAEVHEEHDCAQTMFMSPFHFPVHFSVNESIYSRKDKTCRWNFIGTEPCIPKISCDTSQMKGCEEEYMEIVDGHKGAMKVCSGDKVENATASGDLRDLFIHYKVVKSSSAGSKSEAILAKCTVVCGKRGEGNQLPSNFTAKVNPKCYCGTKPNDDRILGGENAKKFEFPWLVALVETNTRQPFCGGSIINNRYIQSAGHCIKGKFVDYRNIQVVVNGHEFDVSPNSNPLKNASDGRTYPQEELDKMDKGNGSVRYNIDEILVHPLYVSENNDFDIALLKLQIPLDLSSKPTSMATSPLQQPRAICLPPLGSYLRTFSNKKAIIAGWGLPGMDAVGTPQILQKLEVNVFSPAKCKQFFAHRINRRMLCAGHAEGGKDACSGDSGGPLVVEVRPKVWMQIGSVSWGEGCGEPGYPGVYFRTTEGIQWVTYMANYYRGEEDDDQGATWCVVP